MHTLHAQDTQRVLGPYYMHDIRDLHNVRHVHHIDYMHTTHYLHYTQTLHFITSRQVTAYLTGLCHITPFAICQPGVTLQ